jgi:hypothetical protein
MSARGHAMGGGAQSVKQRTLVIEPFGSACSFLARCRGGSKSVRAKFIEGCMPRDAGHRLNL